MASLRGKAGLLGFFAAFLSMGAEPLAAKKIPTVMLIPDSLYVSPNDDALYDSIRFNIKTENVHDVMSWDLQFKDSSQIVRKTISGLKELPKEMVWDGKDEYGARAPEGSYEVLLKVWDSKNKFMEASVQKIVLDMTPPTLSLSAHSKTARVNKDGALLPLTFYFSAVDLSGLKEWKIQFLDEKRQAFHTESAAGPLPENWTYNGANFPRGSKKMMAILGVTDMAYNKAASPPIEIEVESQRDARLQEKPKTPEPEPATRSAAGPGPLLQMTSIVSIADLFGDDADDQSQLLPQAETLLSPLAQALLNAPGSRATIIGHVDSSAGAKDAKTLSSYFAWKVFSYFVRDKGVDKFNLSVKGLGADVPIADNRNSLGRTRNRRIEVQLFLPRIKS